MTDIAGTQEAGLSRLLDERAILRLNAAYNWACYERDAEAYADCFLDDGVYESSNAGTRHVGREELRHGILAAKDSAWLMGHVTTDSLVEVDGDEATQKVFLLLYRRESRDGENTFFASGYYIDRLRRTDHGWRLAHRTSFVDRANVPWSDHTASSAAR